MQKSRNPAFFSVGDVHLGMAHNRGSVAAKLSNRPFSLPTLEDHRIRGGVCIRVFGLGRMCACVLCGYSQDPPSLPVMMS